MKTESDKQITLGSLFDGIGGFPFCAVLSGIMPVWAAEVDPACVAVTKRRFPAMKHLGDVSKINGAKIPPVDIITFGSPCQDLSVAGERRGLKHSANGDAETTRSGLFMDAIRIINEMREATNGSYPSYIVWEKSKELSTPAVAEIFKPCWRRSQRPIFQFLQADDGQKREWFEGVEFALHGDCLTLNIGESPSEESVSTLSKVLEAIVPLKYFLSATACGGILRRAKKRNKPLPPLLQKALEEQADFLTEIQRKLAE